MSWPSGLDRQALLSVFLAESASGCLSMSDAVRQLKEEPADEGARRRLLCVVHSLRGNARSFGFKELAEQAHLVEEILLHKSFPWTPEVRELLGAAAAAFRAMVPRAVHGEEEVLPQERILFEGLQQAVDLMAASEQG